MTVEFEDGNALAGPLAELFAVDMTTAVGRCVSCGLVGEIATLTVRSPDEAATTMRNR